MYIRFRHLAASALSCSLLFTGVCLAQTTELISVDSLGVQGDSLEPGALHLLGRPDNFSSPSASGVNLANHARQLSVLVGLFHELEWGGHRRA